MRLTYIRTHISISTYSNPNYVLSEFNVMFQTLLIPYIYIILLGMIRYQTGFGTMHEKKEEFDWKG